MLINDDHDGNDRSDYDDYDDGDDGDDRNHYENNNDDDCGYGDDMNRCSKLYLLSC